jgi:hypothetical protein
VVQATKPNRSEPSKPDMNASRQSAAERALAEAEERRRSAALAREERPVEVDGRAGLEPVRYGDWEVNGLASDF